MTATLTRRKRRTFSPPPVERIKLTPRELSQMWGVDVEAILRLIHKGELRAVDVATSRGKPRWLIDRADVADFERRRAAHTPDPAKSAPRKRRQPAGRIQFYAE